jgi:predicted Zn-dependent protease
MKSKILGIFLIAFLLFPSVIYAANKENYNKGWAAFSINDRKGARKHFELATREQVSKAEAYLSLALLDWIETKDDQAVVNFRKFYENSDNPYPYLYAMYSMPFMRPTTVMSDDLRKFYEKIVTDPKMNGTLKAMIYEKLGKDYTNRNKLKKGNEYFNKIGALDKWQVLGSFDNISGSGFDKDWGAVANPEPNKIFKNKVDADVKWYTPSANREDKWFLFDYYFSLNSVVAYAQTFVQSPENKEVYMRVGTSGSLKVWVNDALVSVVEEERNCDLDIYSYKITLNKGNNRILVQIGQSETSSANFMLRLTDENGNPVDGLTHTSEYASYQKSTQPANNDILPFFAEEYFEQKIKDEPDNLLYYIALGETYLRNDKSYEGTHVLKKAEELAPNSTLIRFRLSEAYLRANNQTDYSREIENIKLSDPTSFIALSNLFRESINTEKILDAEKTLKEIKRLYGNSEATEEMDIEILAGQKKIEEMIKLCQKLYAKYPYSYDYMYICFNIQENVYKNTRAAMAILENYCKKYYNARALNLLANCYDNLGNTRKALETYKKRINIQPYATGFIFEYARLLLGMQRYNEALQVVNDVKKLAPYLSEVYNTEGYIYKGMKKDDKAKECFKQSIYYGPTAYDSRTQLRLLNNKKQIFELFPKEDLDQLIKNAPTAKDYPEDNSVILLSENQLVFYPEGAQEHRVQIAVKILNQSGIETWKEYYINYNSNSQKIILDKYEVIKANGQKIKAETNNSGLVVFTNLEVGDVLHLDYRLQDYYSGQLSKHFFDWTLMQFSMPLKFGRYSILIPKDRKFEFEAVNTTIAPAVTDIEDMVLYEWISADQPSIKKEPYMSSYSDAVPTIIFSSIPNWSVISNWYKDLTSNKISSNSDYILKATLAEILKGKENAGQLEKAKLFYEYILKNITYSSVPFMHSNFIPQKASRTITTRLGDCKDVSTLFVALCREVGIKANLVLISTRDNGRKILSLPSNYFNHCIAQLEIDGKIYYLELTDNTLPFAAALEVDLQANILPIPYKNESIGSKLLSMDMPFRLKNDLRRKTKITIVNNDFKIHHQATRYGELASYYRDRFVDMGSEDRLKEMNQSVASSWNVPVKVTNLKFEHLDDLCDSVPYSYDIEATGAMQNVAGMKIFKLPWSEAIQSLAIVALDKRKYSLEFWKYIYGDTEYEEITIILPKGKKFVEIPKNVKLSCAAASYELTFNFKKAGQVKVKRIFKKKKDIVGTGEYKEFKKFINAVSENDNKQYVLK